MKFLCDVHISYKITDHIKSLGCEAVHVNSILDKWFTSDAQICQYADENDFIVVSKDSDFRNSFYINSTPKKLIKINLGNCTNNDVMKIFSDNINSIELLNAENSFIIEIDKGKVHFNLKNE